MSIEKKLLQQKIVVLETDTVPGLFTMYDNERGIQKLQKIKKRDDSKPFQVFISDFEQLKILGVEKNDARLLKKFLPGHFTVIVKTKFDLPFIVKDGKIGIRYIKNKRLNDLIKKIGKPLAATSADKNGKSLNNKIIKDIYGKKKIESNAKIPSTIIEICDNGYKLLRKGKGSIKGLDVEFALGSDHAGFELKEEIKKWFSSMKIRYLDVGVFNGNSVDYPDIAHSVAGTVQKKEIAYGILICGTGIGMSISANRFKGVRAALCYCKEYASLARRHNNANLLVLGGGFLDKKELSPILNAFVKTKFEGGRHLRRIRKIEKI
jgi:ribose 5-phosphate isomerase B